MLNTRNYEHVRNYLRTKFKEIGIEFDGTALCNDDLDISFSGQNKGYTYSPNWDYALINFKFSSVGYFGGRRTVRRRVNKFDLLNGDFKALLPAIDTCRKESQLLRELDAQQTRGIMAGIKLIQESFKEFKLKKEYRSEFSIETPYFDMELEPNGAGGVSIRIRRNVLNIETAKELLNKVLKK